MFGTILNLVEATYSNMSRRGRTGQGAP
jgi:hypothetical protein